jgi:hypothetical protein
MSYNGDVPVQPQNAVHPPPNPILQSLALQEGYFWGKYAPIQIPPCKRPKRLHCVLRHDRRAQAARHFERDLHECKRRALARMRAQDEDLAAAIMKQMSDGELRPNGSSASEPLLSHMLLSAASQKKTTRYIPPSKTYEVILGTESGRWRVWR